MVHHHSHRHGLMSYYINSFHLRLKAKRNKQKAPRDAVFFFLHFYSKLNSFIMDLFFLPKCAFISLIKHSVDALRTFSYYVHFSFFYRCCVDDASGCRHWPDVGYLDLLNVVIMQLIGPFATSPIIYRHKGTRLILQTPLGIPWHWYLE